MGKSISESMKALSEQEKNYIKDIVSLTQENSLITKRKLTHINDFLNYRLSQIEALSYNLSSKLEDDDSITKFELFKTTAQQYAAEDCDFGNTLSSIFLVLNDEIQRAKVYDKETKEFLKWNAALSNYLIETMSDFDDKLKEIQNAS